MGLLDFDDNEILKGMIPANKPRYQRRKDEVELEENFGSLQQLGHEKQSADFSDSPFADRQPKKEEEQI